MVEEEKTSGGQATRGGFHVPDQPSHNGPEGLVSSLRSALPEKSYGLGRRLAGPAIFGCTQYSRSGSHY